MFVLWTATLENTFQHKQGMMASWVSNVFFFLFTWFRVLFYLGPLRGLSSVASHCILFSVGAVPGGMELIWVGLTGFRSVDGGRR